MDSVHCRCRQNSNDSLLARHARVLDSGWLSVRIVTLKPRFGSFKVIENRIVYQVYGLLFCNCDL